MAEVTHSTQQERILVMRYRFIGDTLLTVPFLRQLRAAKPDALIDVLVAPKSGEVLLGCPHINHLIFFDTTTNNSSRPFWQYALDLRHHRYDTVFVLKRSFSSALLAWLAGIPKRIGFDTEARGWLLTKRVPYQENRHELDCFLDALEAANIPINRNNRQLECWPSADDQLAARDCLTAIKSAVSTTIQKPCIHIVLHLTSSNSAKEWPFDQADILANWLLDDHHIHIHTLGAASDSAVYETLRTTLPEETRHRLHNHCGQFSLTESLAFLQLMQLVIGVDSGSLHMAAAAQVPVIALFGPMNPAKWAPPGATVITPDAPCSQCQEGRTTSKLKGCRCMLGLRAETVIETINPILGKIARP
jgi:heptosyltransferase II